MLRKRFIFFVNKVDTNLFLNQSGFLVPRRITFGPLTNLQNQQQFSVFIPAEVKIEQTI